MPCQPPHSLYGEKMRTLMAPLSRRVSGLPAPALLTLALFLPIPDFAQPPPATPAVDVALQDRARGFLDAGLKDKNPDTRVQAVQSLGLVGPVEPYISQLEAMLADKDVPVRLATIASLVDLKNKRTVGSLQKALNDEAPEVGFAAAKALWSLKDPAGKAALVSVLSGEMKTSSSFMTKQKRDALRLLHTPRPLFWFALKTGVGIAPVPGLGEGVSSLQGILSDPSVSGRAATALLLATEKDPQILLALLDALSDKDATVRAAAVHAIALRNDPAFEKNLVPLLDDPKPPVRFRAAAGCLRLELVKATPPAKKPAPKAPVKKPAPAAATKKG
jgi:HEAT repeat protein